MGSYVIYKDYTSPNRKVIGIINFFGIKRLLIKVSYMPNPIWYSIGELPGLKVIQGPKEVRMLNNSPGDYNRNICLNFSTMVRAISVAPGIIAPIMTVVATFALVVMITVGLLSLLTYFKVM